MKDLLKRWLGIGNAAAVPKKKPLARRPAPAPALVMLKDTTFPIVDWEAMDAHVPADAKTEILDAFWTTIAKAWLDSLRVALGKQYSIRESERFLLLSPLEASGAKVTLDYMEKTRKRILRVLDGVAKDSEIGKVCVLIFENADQYYRYVSNYYPPQGEFSLSGGMFLQKGYGHFAFVKDGMGTMEPTIAHELTHCMVQHLSIPAWLNEGMAVNTEHRLSPPPGRPLFTPEEMHEKHMVFWNEQTIQEFWSGKSWLRPDEANMLSYDLAQHFVSMTALDFDIFRRFANAANASDSGDAAALKHLSYPVAHLAEAVLGQGPWQPKPETWKDGVERGQFKPLHQE
ncbi:MAG: hypothetical protein ACREQB_02500 [Candidatus Binataceae bacterium]